MRTVSSTILDLWDRGGPFIGEDGAPHSRVTVEPDWFLTQSFTAGNFPKPPVRWFQRILNDQVEVEVPNVRSISTERSVDQDAARCTIVLNNQWHFVNGAIESLDVDELGQPGYYTWSRGDHPEAQARWHHEQNDWNSVIIPNALLRTYQGYGGKEKTIEDAVDDGNLILTGVWLIDNVSTNTQGLITLTCRDMAKLLIDQFIFPPLVPDNFYPPTYCRYYFTRGGNPRVIYGDYAPAPYDRANGLSYRASTGDEDGNDTPQAGHAPSGALDQTTETWWLSLGRGASTDWVYYEVNCNEPIETVAWTPLWGNYDMYVSIYEDGAWVNFAGTIPAPSGYNEAFVFHTGVAFEYGGTWKLPRVFRATRVRFTFTNLYRTEIEGTTYRAAMRELSVGRENSLLPTKSIESLAAVDGDLGYWLVGTDGGVFTLGNLPFHGSSAGGGTENPWATILAKGDKSGYWTIRTDGKVFTFGSAVHYGDLSGLTLSGPIFDADLTPTENGYWLMGADGGVFAFGDAAYYGNATAGTTLANVPFAFEARPQGDGYWIVRITGQIHAYGAAVHYGDGISNPFADVATGIAATPSGNGYWVVTEDGSVYAFGDAQYLGGANTIPSGVFDEITDIVRGTGTNQGYTLVARDGGVFNYGTAFWGSLPGEFSWEVRRDGNYKDYADIIKDLLLWSGWWLQDAAAIPSAPPVVYGTIQETGIFNNTGDGCLPEDMFASRPVIDPINELKEIVGYNFWIDEEGAAHFEAPNWFVPGNFVQETGDHTTFIPIIDERTNLIDYSVNYSDAVTRSEIIISTADPTADLTDTITARLTVEDLAEDTRDLLRGMVKPMMWVNGTFQNQDELNTMAERVAIQILFNLRKSSIQCAFNPSIQINDQVQVYERQTSEVYIHYVRGITIQHDLEQGRIAMNLETHWLGAGEEFVLDTWNTNNPGGNDGP